MKFKFGLILTAIIFTSCSLDTKEKEINQSLNSIIGTWELISATTTEKDTTFSTFNPKHKMIKIINSTHFAFFEHDLVMGKDSSASFTAGGGIYTLIDSVYTEHLEYFIYREWENNKFQFVVKVKNDTLTQRGVEKLEKLGVDRIITEKYKKINN